MNSVYNVIIRPIVSERTFDQMGDNKYTFEVAGDAAKQEIASAVEQIFNVKVVKVNTMWVKPKNKRVRYAQGKTRRWKGKTRRWKKAIVTLAEGDTIEIFGQQVAE